MVHEIVGHLRGVGTSHFAEIASLKSWNDAIIAEKDDRRACAVEVRLSRRSNLNTNTNAEESALNTAASNLAPIPAWI